MESVLSGRFQCDRDETAWKNVGVNYTFGANGQMDPLIANLTLNNVIVERGRAR